VKISVLDQSIVASGSPPAQALHNSVDLALLSERLGYHRYWVAEHHGLPSHASTAPEILIARIAAGTSEIRVGSGGVLLPYYSPMKVAETFRSLLALFGDRIDLGIGRSAGANTTEYLALRRDIGNGPFTDDFDEKLTETLAFLRGDFPADHPFRSILVMPGMPTAPPVWLLGSSPNSAVAAARLGLPYAYAHFINPNTTRIAVQTYRKTWADLGRDGTPQVIVGVGVYCADTEAQSRRLLASHLEIRRRLFANAPIDGVPDPDESLRALQGGPDPLGGENTEFPRYFAGAPEQVRSLVTRLGDELEVDELIAMNMIYDHQDRRRTYEMLAEAMQLAPRAASAPSVAG
jgi:luciferase family oxidoreductase group 1